MTTFTQQYRAPVGSSWNGSGFVDSMPQTSLNQFLGFQNQLGGFRFLANYEDGAIDQALNDFLGQYNPGTGALYRDMDAGYDESVRAQGLDRAMANNLLAQRAALRNGTSRAFLNPQTGGFEVRSQGDENWTSPIGEGWTRLGGQMGGPQPTWGRSNALGGLQTLGQYQRGQHYAAGPQRGQGLVTQPQWYNDQVAQRNRDSGAFRW